MSRQLIANERFRPGLRFGEDADFYHRILNASMKVQIMPDVVYYYNFRRTGNTVSGPNDDRSLDYLDSARYCYSTLSRKGWPIAGMKRMMVVINQVTSKVSPEQSLCAQSVYLNKCRRVAWFPSLKDKCSFFMDHKIDRYQKKLYLSLLINPWHFQMLLKRRK